MRIFSFRRGARPTPAPVAYAQTVDWQQRFVQQARWTEPARAYLLEKARQRRGAAVRQPFHILEAGCGAGAICAWLAAQGVGYAHNVTGLDIRLPFLRQAQASAPGCAFTCGDALRLPFAPSSFDAVTCHFLLLWLADPSAAMAEMVRVVRPGGAVIAFAEPDYGGRIDYPTPLAETGRLQAQALTRQGADASAGRKLRGWFHAAGLADVEAGLLGGTWQQAPSAQERALEWSVLEADLAGVLPAAELRRLREADEEAWQNGQRVLFVPTFYAIGWKG
jgi:ubiquinone/menaquinone biosynthesis C-methylase UbiE